MTSTSHRIDTRIDLARALLKAPADRAPIDRASGALGALGAAAVAAGAAVLMAGVMVLGPGVALDDHPRPAPGQWRVSTSDSD